jgi:virginiamycin B lyase
VRNSTARESGSGSISALSRPVGVAVDSHYIYWTNSYPDEIGRANYDGTGIDQSFITGAVNPSGLAVSDDYIYWSDNAHPRPHHRRGRLISPSIARADLDGADPDQRFIAIHPYPAYTLALSTP